jgi:hypothetical protein
VTSKPAKLWAARACIALVLLSNMQCAVLFWTWPQIYAPSFELSGAVGEATVRGMAVLFVMWNVPYIVALWHPQRHRLSLWEATVMQALGTVGETVILWMLPANIPVLHASLLRFIIFDGAGFLVLLAAVWLTRTSYGPSHP